MPCASCSFCLFFPLSGINKPTCLLNSSAIFCWNSGFLKSALVFSAAFTPASLWIFSGIVMVLASSLAVSIAFLVASSSITAPALAFSKRSGGKAGTVLAEQELSSLCTAKVDKDDKPTTNPASVMIKICLRISFAAGATEYLPEYHPEKFIIWPLCSLIGWIETGIIHLGCFADGVSGPKIGPGRVHLVMALCPDWRVLAATN